MFGDFQFFPSARITAFAERKSDAMLEHDCKQSASIV